MNLLPRIQPLLLAAALAGAAASGGCAPWEGQPRANCGMCGPAPLASPPGTALAMWQEREVAKAEADRFVIYRLDWLGQSPQLKPFAVHRLQALTQRGGGSAVPLVIEPSGNESLDQARQNEIVRLLAESGAPGAQPRVIVQVPQALGLRGEEAEQAKQNVIQGASSAAPGEVGPWSPGPRAFF